MVLVSYPVKSVALLSTGLQPGYNFAVQLDSQLSSHASQYPSHFIFVQTESPKQTADTESKQRQFRQPMRTNFDNNIGHRLANNKIAGKKSMSYTYREITSAKQRYRQYTHAFIHQQTHTNMDTHDTKVNIDIRQISSKVNNFRQATGIDRNTVSLDSLSDKQTQTGSSETQRQTCNLVQHASNKSKSCTRVMRGSYQKAHASKRIHAHARTLT